MGGLLGPTLHLLVASTFAFVAWHHWRRRSVHAHPMALRFFVVWWAALALVEGGVSAQGALAAAGNHSIAWHAGIEYVITFAFSIGLWGLLTYAFYLWGAPERVWIGTGAYYGIYGGLALATIAWLQPVQVLSTDLGVQIVFAREVSTTWLRLISGLFLVPPVVAALGILHVARDEIEPRLRHRAYAVAAGLILWCLGTWLSFELIRPGGGILQVVPLLMNGIAGILVVAAYQFLGFRRAVEFQRVELGEADGASPTTHPDGPP